MHFSVANLISPHYCCSCGKIGSPLCEYCKYNIISDEPQQCLACLQPTKRYGDTCASCLVPYTRGWFVALHRDSVRRLVADYKFKRLRQAGSTLASLLDLALPQLPGDLAIVPVPTVASHIRQRGYDHAALLAKAFAKKRGLPYRPVLARSGNYTQRGASRRVRLQQAARAFTCPAAVTGRFLLIDDVCTTGATVRYAAQALRQAGASQVWVAVVSREPLD